MRDIPRPLSFVEDHYLFDWSHIVCERVIAEMVNVLNESSGTSIFLILGGSSLGFARLIDGVERKCFPQYLNERTIP